MIRAVWGMARNDLAVWLRSPAGWPLVLALILTGAVTVYLIHSYSRRDRP